MTHEELESMTFKPAQREYMLTKREQFAAMAMQGILAGIHQLEGIGSDMRKQIAPFAVELADELLEELDKEAGK